MLEEYELVNFTKIKINKTAENRRFRLKSAIEEQIRLASDDNYVPTEQNWVSTIDGNVKCVNVPKKVKRWWYREDDGIYLTIQYNKKTLQLKPGKNAIKLNSVPDVVKTLNYINRLIDDGSMDEVLSNRTFLSIYN